MLGPTARAKDCMASARSNALQLSQNQVEGLAQIAGQHGRRRKIDVAFRAADRQAGAGELLGSTRTHQERHVSAGFEQSPAEITTDGAGADDQDAHGSVPFS